MRSPTDRVRSQGQVSVIVALALVAIVAMAGLLIDGGTAFAQQRIAQNGSDGTATAGTVVVAQSLSGVARTGNDVKVAVDSVAAANGLNVLVAEYTDDLGQPIGQNVTNAGPIPANARGFLFPGSRSADAHFPPFAGAHT